MNLRRIANIDGAISNLRSSRGHETQTSRKSESPHVACYERAIPVARLRALAAFTMVEIAICIAVIGFALVAIIGIMPSAVNVQKDNREETLIDYDAAYWMEAIRSSAQGIDELTNYVVAIVATNSTGQRSAYEFGEGSLNLNGGNYRNGRDIVGLLTYWSSVDADYRVYADVIPLTGAAASIPKNRDSREFATKYRMTVEITSPRFPNPDLDAAVTRELMEKAMYEVRIVFRWPVIGNGVGNGRKTYRAAVSGRLDLDAEPPLGFFYR